MGSRISPSYLWKKSERSKTTFKPLIDQPIKNWNVVCSLSSQAVVDRVERIQSIFNIALDLLSMRKLGRFYGKVHRSCGSKTEEDKRLPQINGYKIIKILIVGSQRDLRTSKVCSQNWVYIHLFPISLLIRRWKIEVNHSCWL